MTVELNDRGEPASYTDGRLHRTVAAINETWRVDDDWWREPLTRQYADVALTCGAHVVLYEDLATSEWFVQKP